MCIRDRYYLLAPLKIVLIGAAKTFGISENVILDLGPRPNATVNMSYKYDNSGHENLRFLSKLFMSGKTVSYTHLDVYKRQH